jgi:hypothetical protein
MHHLTRLTLLFCWLLLVAGCKEVDMKEGHPLGWTLVLLCILLGVMVVVTPVTRKKKLKKQEEE